MCINQVKRGNNDDISSESDALSLVKHTIVNSN